MGRSVNGAYQVTTVATKIPLDYATAVFFQNKGPNPIYLGASAAACTPALGIEVAAGGGELALDKDGATEVWAITTGANQVSPNDLRWWMNAWG